MHLCEPGVHEAHHKTDGLFLGSKSESSGEMDRDCLCRKSVPKKQGRNVAQAFGTGKISVVILLLSQRAKLCVNLTSVICWPSWCLRRSFFFCSVSIFIIYARWLNGHRNTSLLSVPDFSQWACPNSQTWLKQPNARPWATLIKEGAPLAYKRQIWGVGPSMQSISQLCPCILVHFKFSWEDSGDRDTYFRYHAITRHGTKDAQGAKSLFLGGRNAETMKDEKTH